MLNSVKFKGKATLQKPQNASTSQEMWKDRIQDEIKQLKLERNMTEGQRQELMRLQGLLKFYDAEVHRLADEFAVQTTETLKRRVAVESQEAQSAISVLGVGAISPQLRQLVDELQTENTAKERKYKRLLPPECSRLVAYQWSRKTKRRGSVKTSERRSGSSRRPKMTS